MHTAILDVCACTINNCHYTTESIWNNIKTKVFLFVNIDAILYFQHFSFVKQYKRKWTSDNAQFKLKVISYAEENSNRNFAPKIFYLFFN